METTFLLKNITRLQEHSNVCQRSETQVQLVTPV